MTMLTDSNKGHTHGEGVREGRGGEVEGMGLERTHHGPHDHVDDQLHLGPRPHGAEVERLLAHRGEGELTFLEQRRVIS